MNIVILTGAGISAESGIATFRGPDGLWAGHRVEDVCTPEAFARDPNLVDEFYNQRRRALQEENIKPNAAHLAIANLEQTHHGKFLLVTQNIDDLHERAGNRKIIHMHGELLSARCLMTGKTFLWRGDLNRSTPHPDDPNLKGQLRPNIVWFGEMPLQMGRIEQALQNCDLFLSIGTSGFVYPAANFVEQTPSSCRKVEINIAETQTSNSFGEHIVGPASQRVSEFLATLP